MSNTSNENNPPVLFKGLSDSSKFSMKISKLGYEMVLKEISRCLSSHGYVIVNLELKPKLVPNQDDKCFNLKDPCDFWYFDMGKHQILINEPYSELQILRAYSSGGFTRLPPNDERSHPPFHKCLCEILNRYRLELRSLWAREYVHGRDPDSVWWTFNFYDLGGPIQKSYTFEIDVKDGTEQECYWVSPPGNGTYKICDDA